MTSLDISLLLICNFSRIDFDTRDIRNMFARQLFEFLVFFIVIMVDRTVGPVWHVIRSVCFILRQIEIPPSLLHIIQDVLPVVKSHIPQVLVPM